MAATSPADGDVSQPTAAAKAVTASTVSVPPVALSAV